MNSRPGLAAPENMVHFVHFGDHLLAFCRSKPSDVPGALYLGSLNSNPETDGTNVGMTLVEDVIDTLGRDKPIYACVGPGRERLVQYYCKRFDFEQYGVGERGKVLLRRAPHGSEGA